MSLLTFSEPPVMVTLLNAARGSTVSFSRWITWL